MLVARFTDADLAGTAGDYTATVAWGDGETSSTTAGDVTIAAAAGGGFDVSASKPHPYGEAGTAALVVTVRDGGSSYYSADTWTPVASLPASRTGLAAATGPDGRLYALGGLNSFANPVSTAYAYAPSTNTWATVANLPAPLSDLAATTGPDGRIYALGGRDSVGNPVSTVYAYAPSNNTWSTVGPLPAPLTDLAATTGPDGRIYALGGQDSVGNPVSTVYAYAAAPIPGLRGPPASPPRGPWRRRPGSTAGSTPSAARTPAATR